MKNLNAIDWVLKNENTIKGYYWNKCNDKEVVKDVFQNLALKIIEKENKEKFKHENALVAWCWKVVKTVFADYYRLENRRRQIFWNYDNTPNILNARNTMQPQFQTDYEVEQVKKEVKKAVASLPKSQEIVFRMRAMEKIPFKQIANIFDISINTAIGQMRYARQGMKKKLEVIM